MSTIGPDEERGASEGEEDAPSVEEQLRRLREEREERREELGIESN